MDTRRIIRVLEESSLSIKKAESFSDRLTLVYKVLDKAFPKTSKEAALYGPITSMGDYMTRAEIEPLLQTLQESAKTGRKFVVIKDDEMNTLLSTIYEMVK